MIKVLSVACLASAVAFSPATSRRQTVQMSVEGPSIKKILSTAVAGIFTIGGFNLPAQAVTKAELSSLSYEQVKGSGLANRCPEVIGEGSIALSSGKKYKVTDLCIEPKAWQVEEEVAGKKGEAPTKQFVNTKLMTRQTYTLDGISGTLEVKDGATVFTEEDGIDYAATTVQLPGRERVPFLFTVKNLVAKGSAGPLKPGFELGGSYVVPSYRTGLFLDPKGRGTTTGYDFAGALPGLQTGDLGKGDEKLFKENNKKFDVLKGDIEFAVNRVNAQEGEFGGVFVSTQPSDTDMGAKTPRTVLSKGVFYGHIEAAN